MGNHASRRQTAAAAACKVVLSDGSVAEFEGGTSVAELMLEHPQQFVVEFSSLLSGSKASPLPADHKLEPGRVYVMLPIKPGKPSTLSAAEARQVVSRSRSVLRSSSFPSSSSSSSSKSGPLGNWGRPEPGVSNAEGEEGNKAKPEEKMSAIEFPSQAFGEVPEFLSKQLSGRLWKPSLHTIVERAPPRKVSHWLF
ncbi:hypothetical protein Taro_017333 [Colocasia esculenta]|uniref:Uncharacterized protein n=1 Tax=Colocasia esculenta TaxID=4460 RepID=A0A843UNC8_COLES|nr:hypothetical protein [Colocasia esculenta]